MTELQELEAKMLQLVKARDAAIDVAERMIADTNREFDRAAVPLAKAIRRLRGDITTTKTHIRRAQTPKPLELAGLSGDEQEHYKQLLAAKGNKNG